MRCRPKLDKLNVFDNNENLTDLEDSMRALFLIMLCLISIATPLLGLPHFLGAVSTSLLFLFATYVLIEKKRSK